MRERDVAKVKVGTILEGSNTKRLYEIVLLRGVSAKAKVILPMKNDYKKQNEIMEINLSSISAIIHSHKLNKREELKQRLMN